MSYEELFVPALFEPCSTRVVEALGFAPPQRVLDVACGTGALARCVAPRVMPGGRVLGLDMSSAFPSARVMVEADLRGWLPLAGVVLPEAVIEATLADAERAYASFVDDDGAFPFDITARSVRASPGRGASRGAPAGASLRA